MNVIFVILHYMTYEETNNCINSIIKNVQGDYQIIVVDNGSTNESANKLKQTFLLDTKVEILFAERNLGFSNGNNFGYRYAKEKYHPNFIICLNNDTLIEQNNFVGKIKKHYEEELFFVLGPDIIADQGKKHQNPAHKAPFTIGRLRKLLFVKKIYLQVLKSSGIKKKLLLFLYRCFSKIYEVISNYEENKSNEIILHGACLIFSERYIEKNDNAFYDQTFLYLEEDILHFICKQNNWLMVYKPDIKVTHLEDVSTNYVVKTVAERELFKTKYFLNSGKILLNMMRK